MLKTRLAQDASKDRNSGSLHATEVDHEMRPKIFSKERRLHTRLQLTFCSWMSKNKKPQNNKTIYCVNYFIYAQFMPELASKCGSSSSSGWPPLVYSALLFRSVNWVWNVMAHAQKPDFVFRRNGRVHLHRQGRHFSRLLAAEVCASAVVKLDTPYSEIVWRVLALHSIGQFPLHFPSRASPCAITFQLDSTQHLW